MAQRGRPSSAHEYDKSGACIHCHMYRSNVEELKHVCKQRREDLVDAIAAKKAGIDVETWRRIGSGKTNNVSSVPLGK